jgi:putative transposase
LSLDDAERLIAQYVQVYNQQRLHSALGYVTPQAMLEGRRAEIHNERDRKLEQARRQRQQAVRAKSISELQEDAA